MDTRGFRGVQADEGGSEGLGFWAVGGVRGSLGGCMRGCEGVEGLGDVWARDCGALEGLGRVVSGAMRGVGGARSGVDWRVHGRAGARAGPECGAVGGSAPACERRAGAGPGARRACNRGRRHRDAARRFAARVRPCFAAVAARSLAHRVALSPRSVASRCCVLPSGRAAIMLARAAMADLEPNQAPISIVVVEEASPQLAAVIAVWRAHSDTLGYLPSGAFDEAARQGRILAALSGPNSLAGYVLYRTPGDRAVVVHLCVAPEFRSRGVARQLVNALRERTSGQRGLGLTCRRDYDATQLWPRLGFSWVGERAARAEGKSLSFWWLDYQKPDLFSQAQRGTPGRLTVGLDQNVFFDIHGVADMHREVESKSLVADWVQDEIELVVTDEVFNEIERCGRDAADRGRLRRCADTYRRVSCDHEKFESSTHSLRDLFPEVLDASTESDLRHVARAVACGLQVFVTRDGELLEKSSEVFQRYGLTITRPSALVTMLDEVRREHVYQPSRLAGTLLRSRRLRGDDDVKSLMDAFQATARGENQAAFVRVLRTSLASPEAAATEIIGGENAPMGLTALEMRDGDAVVSLVRQARGPSSSTVARFMAERLVRWAAADRITTLTVRDPYIDGDMSRALEEAGFQVRPEDGVLCKTSHFGWYSLSDASAVVGTQAESALTQEEAWRLEQLHRPVKFWDLDVPTYVVPIRPWWAANLFDAELAGELLVGARQDLALRSELVYYRASRPPMPNLPGRILWYASEGDGSFVRARSIRGYSRLDEVLVGPAKELFARFRRLGVYTWEDVLKTAKDVPQAEIMALRFSGTELFRHPLSWEDLQTCLARHGKRSQIQSPTKIGAAAFRDIYAQGMRT